MEITMLVFIISNFCAFKDVTVSQDYKHRCMESMVNCSVIQDGKTTSKQVEYCKELWISKLDKR